MSKTIKLYPGDARIRLLEIESDSVQVAITSPPYYGLRDYKIIPSTWGGDPACEHEWTNNGSSRNKPDRAVTKKSANGSGAFGDERPRGDQLSKAARGAPVPLGDTCVKCSAWLGTFGNEPTPELYIEHFIEIFREVRRVLRPDGLCFVNLGDSYASDTKWGGTTGGKHAQGLHGTEVGRAKRVTGLKDKDLMMMPARCAIALQADGWYLRSQIPWIKHSTMPESVDDRPTTAVEYVFMFSKERYYYYDKFAIQVEASPDTHARYGRGRGHSTKVELADERVRTFGAHMPGAGFKASMNQRGESRQNSSFTEATSAEVVGRRNWRNSDLFLESLRGLIQDADGNPLALFVNPSPMSWQFCDDCKAIYSPADSSRLLRTWFCMACNVEIGNGDFKRIPKTDSRRRCSCGADQWKCKTWCACGSYQDWASHFAGFPELFVEPLIKVGSSEKGCCPECRTPYERIVEPTGEYAQLLGKTWADSELDAKEGRGHSVSKQREIKRSPSISSSYNTVGWKQGCECPPMEPIPCVVMDFFSGAGTTPLMSARLNRSSISIEIKPEYVQLSWRRIIEDNPLFNIVEIIDGRSTV